MDVEQDEVRAKLAADFAESRARGDFDARADEWEADSWTLPDGVESFTAGPERVTMLPRRGGAIVGRYRRGDLVAVTERRGSRRARHERALLAVAELVGVEVARSPGKRPGRPGGTTDAVDQVVADYDKLIADGHGVGESLRKVADGRRGLSCEAVRAAVARARRAGTLPGTFTVSETGRTADQA